MDKRFFLALFLSLIAIAVSQLLFPPTKPVPAARVTADSSAASATASTTVKTATSVSSASANKPQIALARATVAAPGSSLAGAPAETTLVSTPKVLYQFSNMGAAPVSIVMRDYVNRSTAGGL